MCKYRSLWPKCIQFQGHDSVKHPWGNKGSPTLHGCVSSGLFPFRRPPWEFPRKRDILLPLRVQGGALPPQQLQGCRLLVPLLENICYSLGRIETEHKTVFQQVVPPTPHPSDSWKKTNSKMRTESQANIVTSDDTFIYIHIYVVAGGREILVPDLLVGQWSTHTLVAACHPSG